MGLFKQGSVLINALCACLEMVFIVNLTPDKDETVFCRKCRSASFFVAAIARGHG